MPTLSPPRHAAARRGAGAGAALGALSKRDRVVQRPRQRDLNVAQRARPEPGLAEREIEVPRALEDTVVAERANLVDVLVDVPAPAPKRLGVVRADLVHVEHRQPRRRGGRVRQRGQRRDQAAREHVLLDPVGGLAVAIPAVVGDQDRLNAGDTARLEHAVDRGEVGAELLLADRLEHLDRRHLGVVAVVHSVVLLDDLHSVGETLHCDPLAGERRLLGGDRQAGDAAAGRTGSVQRESAPAAADLEHVIGDCELQLIADPLQLRALRVCERRIPLGEDPAGIGHRLVEHQLEELIAEVVVVRNVPSSAKQPVAAVRPRPCLDHPAHETVPRNCGLGVAQEQREEPHQVVGVPLAGGVRLAEADLAARREAPEECAVVDPERHRADLSRTSAVPRREASLRAIRPRGARAHVRGSPRRSDRPRRRGHAGRRARVRSTVLMRAPTPAPARTAACGGMAPVSAKASGPGGG